MIKTRLLHKRIKSVRGERGMNQSVLAEKARLTQATLSRIENNQEKPHLNTLVKLAQALDVELVELLVGDVQKEKRLDRHQIEAVARSVLSGERKLGADLNELAQQAASLMIQFLRAHQVPGYLKVRSLRWHAPFRKERVLNEIGEDVFKQLFSRVRKLVSAYEGKYEI